MVRFSVFAATVLTLSLVTACDNASSDQKKIESAQAGANDKTGAAMKQADEKAKSAQAEADEKIAAALADFGKMREGYRHTTTTNLVDIDHKVDDLTAKANLASGEKRATADAKLKEIRASRTAFVEDYKSLENVSGATWDATRARLDKEWKALKTLVDSV